VTFEFSVVSAQLNTHKLRLNTSDLLAQHCFGTRVSLEWRAIGLRRMSRAGSVLEQESCKEGAHAFSIHRIHSEEE
jgi:hypothetical protein